MSVLAFRGRLKRQTKEVRSEQCWAWLQNEDLKRETEYKRRHDNLGKIVHWKLARKCNFEAGDK